MIIRRIINIAKCFVNWSLHTFSTGRSCTRMYTVPYLKARRFKSRILTFRRDRYSVILLCVVMLLTYIFIGYKFLQSFGKVDILQRSNIDYIADHIKVTVNLTPKMPLPSWSSYMNLTLRNTGKTHLYDTKWRIYFTQILRLDQLSVDCGLRLNLVAGRVYYLSPDPNTFRGIPAGSKISCNFMSYNKALKYTQFPNWYVVSTEQGGHLRVIEHTRGETLSFVTVEENEVEMVFNHLAAQKRRYYRFKRMSSSYDKNRIIPTPRFVTERNLPELKLDTTCVVICFKMFNGAVLLLHRRLRLSLTKSEDLNTSHHTCVIRFKLNTTMDREEYNLDINGALNEITITASRNAGAFYAAQSLLSLHSSSSGNDCIPSLSITDKPRFPFRSLMVDVARNFHPVETIVTILETMAMYKLNKFHFHLTDDEGWRVELPSIPELTEYGSRRCHSLDNSTCLLPSYGTNHHETENHGNGFYSVKDYQYILKVAEENNILVIPEIDVPGHATAILTAMKHWKTDPELPRSNPRSRPMTLFDQSSLETSAQGWQHNVMNPCLNSSYEFVSLILDELKHIHEGHQSLQLVHLGGDEVQWTIWDNSQACKTMYCSSAQDHMFLKRQFTKKVAAIAKTRKLKVAFWNDALIDRNSQPIEITDFDNQTVYTNHWYIRAHKDNEVRTVSQFADSGYKVILSTASFFYFDHSYESYYDEIGNQWATDFIDTLKVFNAIPCSYRLNYPHPQCQKMTHPSNVVGVQASVWGEIVRGKSSIMHMLFPRLLALSERAWHAAEWENITDVKTRDITMRKDWTTFANTLGHKEFVRLEKMGITYRVPPPGAYINDTLHSKMHINVAYPNHSVYMKWSPSDPAWQKLDKSWIIVKKGLTILLKSVSPYLKRSSKIVYMYT